MPFRSQLFHGARDACDDAPFRSSQMAIALSSVEQPIAQRARSLNCSAIREILKLSALRR
jgi:hypothetical protein